MLANYMMFLGGIYKFVVLRAKNILSFSLRSPNVIGNKLHRYDPVTSSVHGTQEEKQISPSLGCRLLSKKATKAKMCLWSK